MSQPNCQRDTHYFSLFLMTQPNCHRSTFLLMQLILEHIVQNTFWILDKCRRCRRGKGCCYSCFQRLNPLRWALCFLPSLSTCTCSFVRSFRVYISQHCGPYYIEDVTALFRCTNVLTTIPLPNALALSSHLLFNKYHCSTKLYANLHAWQYILTMACLVIVSEKEVRNCLQITE